MQVLAFWLLLSWIAPGKAHADMPFPTWTQSDWRLEDSPSALSSKTPRQLRTAVLIMGKHQQVASEAVVILIDAPFEAVSPIVTNAWAQQGHQVKDASLPLADLPDQWRQLMLAVQPALRTTLVNKVHGPELAQAVKDGALTHSERARRLQLLNASVDAHSDTLRQAPEFRQPAQRLRYQREWKVGKNFSRDDYAILDLRLIMGRAATAVTIQRRHSLANRQSFALADTPQFSMQNLVPAADFQATLHALTDSLPNAAVRLAETPTVWTPSVPMPDTLPAPVWRVPAVDKQPIKPAIRTFHTDDAISLQAVQAQADGTLIIGLERLVLPKEESLAQAVAELWRLEPGASAPQLLWQGMQGADQLIATLDGKQLWFVGQAFGEKQDGLFHYRQKEGLVELHFPSGQRPSLGFVQWWVGDQAPIMASYSVSTLQQLGDLSLSLPRPVPRAQWFFSDLRLMKGGANPWVEDDQGVAELDSESGRVLRAFTVPPRASARPGPSIRPYLDSRTSKTDTQGVVSAKGKWLATAFKIDDAKSGPLSGVHLLDIEKGTLLYSAVLPDSDKVRLLAASPDGRWLALYGYNRHLLVWEVRSSANPLRLLVPHVTLADLAFSLDSKRLVGVGDEYVLSWELYNKSD